LATPCRLVIDPPADGAWNMAVDETLLRTAIEQSVATLRFYQWSRATLSLGYFQAYADRLQHTPSLECPVVRRSTGGGAIVHDHELTYSLTLPAEHPLAADSTWLYRCVHVELIGLLSEAIGTAERVVQCASLDIAHGQMPFLCFQRRGPEDVVLTDRKVTSDVDWKIAGSAQRRRRGAVLQHGSVLLAATSFAPELPGVAELTAKRFSPEELAVEWAKRLAQPFDIDTKPQALTADEVGATRRTVAEKFASPVWTNRR
jgi:lipoate-protein ligase A